MKLGTETASLANHLLSRMTDGAPTPKVGIGATILCWSDRQAATVVDVEGNRVTVQHDTAIRTDSLGMSDAQEYRYERDPNGPKRTFRQDKGGKWTEVHLNPKTGRWNSNSGNGLILGHRRQYYDFSF